MKTSLNWLRDYVDFDGTPADLAERLTFAGVEVEGVETRGVQLDKVVVAQILASEQHPNADRLSVCRVDDGAGAATPRQIVCGAKNYRVGDKVPLALPGAVLPGDFKIKVGKLRGVESEGMLCSGKELGVAEDAVGLLILPVEARVGAPIGELFPVDTVFDLEVTPNRPDLLSHGGLAREVAALTGKPVRWPAAPAVASARDGAVPVVVDAGAACPFYAAILLEGVTVGPSPGWLRARLESVGLRAINNVVDVTNFVLLETGQPLHAFDAAHVLPAGGIRVRPGRDGEEFGALDGKTYRLAAHHLVIGDGHGGALALAGVMGGERSGVGPGTRDVVLEAACFAPAGIRRTSRELGLASDSSYRFERGVDPGGVLAAGERAAALIEQVAGGRQRAGVSAAGAAGFGRARRTVALRPERVGKLLGVPVDAGRVDAILAGFGLEKTPDAAGVWRVPTFRGDLAREVDLIEEIARVVGLDAVPSSRRGSFTESSATDRDYDFGMTLRRRLAGLGFLEIRTPTLVSGRAAAEEAWFGTSEPAALKNPLSEEQTTLRPSLVPGLLAVAARNARVGVADGRFFELGRVFAADGRGSATAENRPEPARLGLVLSGAALARSWRDAAPRTADLHDLRGVVEGLLPPGEEAEFRRTENARLALAVEIFVGNASLGHAGLVRPATAKTLDVRAPLLVAELDVAALRALWPASSAKFHALPRFPSVTRDLAVLVGSELAHGEIEQTLRGAGEGLLAGVELFDVFTDPTGQRVPAGRKSLAYSLTYRAEDRTLTAEEVNASHARLKERLRGAFDLGFRE